MERTIRVSGSHGGGGGDDATGAVSARESRAGVCRGISTSELTQLIEPGRHVREGEVVAVFDSENMRNRLDNDEADVAQAEGTLKRLRADQAAQMEANQQEIRVARAAVDSAVLDLSTARVRSAIDAQKFALTLEEARATLKALNAEVPNLHARQAAELRSAELELERATWRRGAPRRTWTALPSGHPWMDSWWRSRFTGTANSPRFARAISCTRASRTCGSRTCGR